MKQIGKPQMEMTLRRLMDARIMQDMIYFETVVWAEAKSLQPKGYFVVILCKELMFLIKLDEKGNILANFQPVEVPYHNVVAIERLRDPAKFFAADFARDTQHIRLITDDQIAINEIIDIYVIFEDSHVQCYLEAIWLAVQMSAAWPEMTSQSRCRTVFNFNVHESAILYRALREQLLADVSKSDALENMAVVVGLNQNVKKSVLQTPEVLMKAFDLLTETAPCREYGYFESTIDHVEGSLENMSLLNQNIATLIFYFQLLNGGVHYPDRLVLLDGTLHSILDLTDALLSLSANSEIQHISSSQKSLTPSQPLVLARERAVTAIKEDVLALHEGDFNPVQQKLIEIDNLQAAVLFMLQKLLEYGTHVPDCSMKLEPDLLLRHLLQSNEFCEKRVPRSFQAVARLLRIPVKLHHGMFLYMHCFILNWFCDNSTRVREIIRTKCFTEMQLFSGLLREKRTQNQHDSLFYRKGKELLQMILDSVLTDTDAT